MTWKILVSAPYMQPVIEEFVPFLRENGAEVVLPPVRERLSEEELLQWVSDIDGVMCGDDAFSELVMRAAPRLKVISKWGTGIDSIDKEAAQRLGIAVCNTPDAFTQPVADTILGYMLCFARGIPWMDRDVRANRWQKIPGFSLGEATLGVIGVGNVGKAVVRRAKAFRMGILGNDIAHIPEGFIAETGLRVTDKDQLLAEADFVSLNCDLNPTSHYIVGERELSLMKPVSYLINTARGPLIEERALIKALENESIAGAALDVFEAEPLPTDSRLRHLDNCLLAPHNANASPAAYRKVHENTIRNLLDQLRAQGRSGPE